MNNIEFVKNSENRIKVMKALKSETLIPSEIAKTAGINKKHISTIIKQLREHDLVKCINPEVRKGRLYRLTEKGRKIVEKL